MNNLSSASFTGARSGDAHPTALELPDGAPIAFNSATAVAKAQLAAIAVAQRCKAEKDAEDVARAIAKAPDNQAILQKGFFFDSFGRFLDVSPMQP